MSFPSGYTVYSFAGVTFARVVDGDHITPWAYPETQYTADPVLGTGGLVYVDVGGDTPAVMSFTASCLSAANRATLIAARGTTGTLSNTRSHSDTMVLIKATPTNSPPYSLWMIELTFVLVPS